MATPQGFSFSLSCSNNKHDIRRLYTTERKGEKIKEEGMEAEGKNGERCLLPVWGLASF